LTHPLLSSDTSGAGASRLRNSRTVVDHRETRSAFMDGCAQGADLREAGQHQQVVTLF